MEESPPTLLAGELTKVVFALLFVLLFVLRLGLLVPLTLEPRGEAPPDKSSWVLRLVELGLANGNNASLACACVVGDDAAAAAADTGTAPPRPLERLRL
jgi:hypothetical protein